MYLERLKRYGPKLICVVTLTEQLALEQAATADREIKRGHYLGPLHGIPWGAKDLFATKGIPTTWGAEPFRNQLIDYDATVVERLRKAGAVLVAKLSMGRSQWVAAVCGRDAKSIGRRGGDNRIERILCRVGGGDFRRARRLCARHRNAWFNCIAFSPLRSCGLRPTYGRVSRYGAMGLSWTMDKIGPICRSAEDCAFVLDAIYGPDDRDLTVGSAPFGWDPRVPLTRLRIGISGRIRAGDEARKKIIR